MTGSIAFWFAPNNVSYLVDGTQSVDYVGFVRYSTESSIIPRARDSSRVHELDARNRYASNSVIAEGFLVQLKPPSIWSDVPVLFLAQCWQ